MGHKNVKGLILQEYKKNEVRTRLEDDNVGTRALCKYIGGRKCANKIIFQLSVKGFCGDNRFDICVQEGTPLARETY